MSVPPTHPCPSCGKPRRHWHAGQRCKACYQRDAGHKVAPERTADMPLPEPTDTYPGTPERQAVIEERVRLGQQLWHPGDRADCEGMVGHPAGHATPSQRLSDRRAAGRPAKGRTEELDNYDAHARDLHRCRDCGSRVNSRPGELCPICTRQLRPRPTPPPSPPETNPMSETNGTHAPDAPAKPAGNRLGSTARVEALLREMGPDASITEVRDRLVADGYPPCGSATYYATRVKLYGPAKRTGRPPGSKAAPKVQTPAPATEQPRRIAVAETPAPAPPAPAGDDDLVALVDDVIRLVDRLGAERLTRLVGVIGRRGGAQ